MAKLFYYDLGTADAPIVDGTFAAATWTISNSIVNETLINDQSIGAGASVVANEGVSFDMGASISPIIAAIYLLSGSGTITIYRSASGSNGAKTSVASLACSAGWNFIVLTGNNQWWFAKFGGTMSVGEIFIGGTWTFSNRFDRGNAQSKVHGIDVDRSYGNVKGSNKRFDELKSWNWTWTNISESDKTNLETFENAIDVVRLKFIYFDESIYWWVSKTNAFVFTETAYQYYTTSINLVEEIE